MEERKKKMIKCPNCGSTAQVRSNGNPKINTVDKDILVEGFHCGCGCEWEVDYARNENGYWEILAEVITTKEPINNSKGHIHCPANGYDCPYWKDGLCGLWSEEKGYSDLYEECDDFAAFWDEGDDYIDYGED